MSVRALFVATVCLSVEALHESLWEPCGGVQTHTVYGTQNIVTLNGSDSASNSVILDYEVNVEGFPTFEILSAKDDTSGFEISYSESKAILENSSTSDGPLGLAAAMDTYRVNVYNFTSPVIHTNRLIQGGFRYQKLKLSSAGELVLKNVGVKRTTSTIPVTALPGSFESSDKAINQIWETGARTIQLNEIKANSIPNFWRVTPEGSYVESQAPQVLLSAAALSQYNLTFEVKPIAKGFSFSALASTLNDGIYILCNIANRTISANVGSTERASDFLAMATLPPEVILGKWIRVQATISLTGITVFLNGVQVLDFSQSYSFYGSFGLGAALGHAALFRNLSASSLQGTTIYSSQLNDEAFLKDFLMGTNPLSTLVDGSKRDRITYSGDLDITIGSTLVSTNGTEYLQGALDLIGSFQLPPGFFVPTAKIQQQVNLVPIDANITGLIGYSFSLITAAADFYQRTGDSSIAKVWAPKAARMLDWADSQVLPEIGLFNLTNVAFGGDWNYYDPGQAGVVGKINMIYAYTIHTCLTLLADGDVDTTPYIARLATLRAAINSHLWSDDSGAYIFSESMRNGFGQDTNALAILAAVTNSNHTSSQVLHTMEQQLFTPKGPIAFSSEVIASGFRRLISPFSSGYHLRAALSAGDDESAKRLLDTLWRPMADPAGANYTGCFWEALDSNGAPGLGALTSLCHAWGAGPTGDLSDYVLGIKAVKPGYRHWQVSPSTMGLTWARGKIPVPGGEISVAWNASGKSITYLEVISPAHTNGVIVLPIPHGSGNCTWSWTVNGNRSITGNSTFVVAGGERFQLALDVASE